MTPVLILRPLHRARETAPRIAALGLRPVIAPVLVQRDLTVALDRSEACAFIASSAAGARGLARCGADLSLPIFCVGPATAGAARRAGFTQPIAAQGNAASLIALIEARHDRGKGALVFGRGREVAADIAGALREAGFAVREVTVYAMDIASSLPRDAIDALRGGPGIALAYSARAAQAFIRLLPETLRHICTVVCMSERVAEVLRPHGFKEIVIACRPAEDSMMHALSALTRRGRNTC